MKPVKIDPPAHLQPATAAWWRRLCDSYQFEEHHTKILEAAASAWDRMCSARVAIEAHGLTFEDRFGKPCTRPEIAIERDSRIAFVRCLRELGLDTEEAPETPRPPKLLGTKGRVS